MKLLHISDLHLGKRLNDFSLLEDQEAILGRILEIADRERPRAVLISGDIYDRASPSAEAVQLFDDFLFGLALRSLEVFAVSGNHDSPERIAFASRLIDKSGVHLSPVYDGHISETVLLDEYGPVSISVLPFVKPASVRRFFAEGEIVTYTDAVRAALRELPRDPGVRRVLLAHQYVTGALRSDSEEISVGGLENVDASVFDGFDYVALGHLHSPQNVGSERVRYSGSPLKYSFGESGQEKSVTVAELGDKGELTVRTVPLVPIRDLRSVRGSFRELTGEGAEKSEDYLRVILTDEQDIPDVVGRLRVFYPNLMKVEYDNRRTRAEAQLSGSFETRGRSPLS
ncbi:MAG: exonuclease SbcCD subunit D, partial [Clostridia bacterium]|nr:exonuclease SbcCD subunit D [Clostridia bacterium]